MKLSTLEQVRSVACPYCSAEPGHPCVRPRVANKPGLGTRPLSRHHHARRRALAELERAPQRAGAAS